MNTFDALFKRTVDEIKNEYSNTTTPWIIGYSGGKDSSSIVKFIFHALRELEEKRRFVEIVYCDTGLEIPPIEHLTKQTLLGLANEISKDKLPLRIRIIEPTVQDKFFVKVIGRGYPPPTNKFRWCTDLLRIKPVDKAFSDVQDSCCTVLLGVHHGESYDR